MPNDPKVSDAQQTAERAVRELGDSGAKPAPPPINPVDAQHDTQPPKRNTDWQLPTPYRKGDSKR
jgi:hypothetical protein